MARRRASMREGPLAELFRATEAAQRQGEGAGRLPPKRRPEPPPPAEPDERTVDHVPSWEEAARVESRRRLRRRPRARPDAAGADADPAAVADARRRPSPAPDPAPQIYAEPPVDRAASRTRCPSSRRG